MNKKLTDEQIENWRFVICSSLGLYALMMSNEEIQKLHDKINNIDQKEEVKDE